MQKTDVKYQAYVQILKEELVPAMGCTEPIALAYAAAKAREVLGCIPERVEIGASGSIIKNVKSVIVPNTDHLKGIPAAATAGIIAGNIRMTGASTTNGIMITTSGQNVRIAKNVMLNGVEKGDLQKNTDLSTFIASITPSTETAKTKTDGTSLKNTYYICAFSGTTESSFPYGFTNY